MSDKDALSFLDGDEAPEVEAIQPEPVAEPEGVKEPEPETAPEVKAAPPAVEEKQSTQVPITALLDEREKRQRAQQEAEYYRRLIEQQKPQEKPDFYEDPEKFAAVQQQTVQQALWNERLNMSEAIVRDKHGDEVVDAATQAFQQALQANPALYAEMRQARNPYGYVVDWHKKQSFLSEVGDPDRWKQSQIEALRAQVRAELEAEFTQKAKPAAPPRSLAKAPSAGGEANPPGSTFDELFPG
jgi:hypothetical protein